MRKTYTGRYYFIARKEGSKCIKRFHLDLKDAPHVLPRGRQHVASTMADIGEVWTVERDDGKDKVYKRSQLPLDTSESKRVKS